MKQADDRPENLQYDPDEEYIRIESLRKITIPLRDDTCRFLTWETVPEAWRMQYDSYQEEFPQ